LINWSGVNWRLTLCRIQTPGAKGQIAVINVIHKHAIDGAENTIS